MIEQFPGEPVRPRQTYTDPQSTVLLRGNPRLARRTLFGSTRPAPMRPPPQVTPMRPPPPTLRWEDLLS